MRSELKKFPYEALLILTIITVIAIFYLSSAAQFRHEESRMFPQLVSTVMVVLLAVQFIRELMNFKNKIKTATEIETEEEEEEEAADAGEDVAAQRTYAKKRWIMALIAIVVLLILIRLSGFIVASVIFIPVFGWILGMRKIIPLMITAISSAAFLYFVFVVALKLPIMRSVLFP